MVHSPHSAVHKTLPDMRMWSAFLEHALFEPINFRMRIAVIIYVVKQIEMLDVDMQKSNIECVWKFGCDGLQRTLSV